MSNFVTPEQFAATNKANIETLLTLANTAFASAAAYEVLADEVMKRLFV